MLDPDLLCYLSIAGPLEREGHPALHGPSAISSLFVILLSSLLSLSAPLPLPAVTPQQRSGPPCSGSAEADWGFNDSTGVEAGAPAVASQACPPCQPILPTSTVLLTSLLPRSPLPHCRAQGRPGWQSPPRVPPLLRCMPKSLTFRQHHRHKTQHTPGSKGPPVLPTTCSAWPHAPGRPQEAMLRL